MTVGGHIHVATSSQVCDDAGAPGHPSGFSSSGRGERSCRQTEIDLGGRKRLLAIPRGITCPFEVMHLYYSYL